MFEYNDGGRAEAGYKGEAGDCCCRAFAIASGRPYQEVYDLINKIGKESKNRSKKRSGSGVSTARSGVYTDDAHILAKELGFRWVATMKIGTGCKVHLRADELPAGRIVCNVSKHFVAVINGIINDTYDCSREGTRCVYGYWIKEE